jgi:mannose-6-phosphate isomerase-like protein (cupin superfamily)
LIPVAITDTRRAMSNPLVLENRHTGERLEVRRVTAGGETWLTLLGSLPPHREGPPLHIHFREQEVFRVVAGTLSAVSNGHQVRVAVGGAATFPARRIAGGTTGTRCSLPGAT